MFMTRAQNTHNCSSHKHPTAIGSPMTSYGCCSAQGVKQCWLGSVLVTAHFFCNTVKWDSTIRLSSAQADSGWTLWGLSRIQVEFKWNIFSLSVLFSIYSIFIYKNKWNNGSFISHFNMYCVLDRQPRITWHRSDTAVKNPACYCSWISIVQ